MNSVGFSKDAVIVLPTSNENKGKNMTKKIVKIIENKDGDVNPTTDLQEKPVFEILFDDSTSRKLFRHKVKEYLSMSYKKAVGNFNKVRVDTPTSHTVIWNIVFQDYTIETLPPKIFYRRLEEGHEIRDLEESKPYEWNKENTE